MIDFTQALVEKHTGIEQAIEIATTACSDKCCLTRQEGLNLFITLVKKNNTEAFASATKAAINGITSGNYWTKDKAIDLLEALFYKNQAIKEAIEIAQSAFMHSHLDIRDTTLKLIKLLCAKNYLHAHIMATELATAAIRNKDVAIQYSGLQLLDFLIFEKDHAYKEAIEAFLICSASNSRLIQAHARDCLNRVKELLRAPEETHN